jgi:hypothetical protein
MLARTLRAFRHCSSIRLQMDGEIAIYVGGESKLLGERNLAGIAWRRGLFVAGTLGMLRESTTPLILGRVNWPGKVTGC